LGGNYLKKSPIFVIMSLGDYFRARSLHIQMFLASGRPNLTGGAIPNNVSFRINADSSQCSI